MYSIDCSKVKWAIGMLSRWYLHIFGTRDYGPIYGMVVSVNRFGGVIGNVLVSLLFDITKSSAAVWPVCVAAMVLTLVAILYCMSASKKMMATQQAA